MYLPYMYMYRIHEVHLRRCYGGFCDLWLLLVLMKPLNFLHKVVRITCAPCPLLTLCMFV